MYHSSLNPAAMGRRAARMAGNRPPISHMHDNPARPRVPDHRHEHQDQNDDGSGNRHPGFGYGFRPAPRSIRNSSSGGLETLIKKSHKQTDLMAGVKLGDGKNCRAPRL
jgi:hypothetical protein